MPDEHQQIMNDLLRSYMVGGSYYFKYQAALVENPDVTLIEFLSFEASIIEMERYAYRHRREI